MSIRLSRFVRNNIYRVSRTVNLRHQRRLSFLEHAQNPESGGAGSQMLQRVPADGVMVQVENRPVRGLKYFCQHVEKEYDDKIETARIARGKKQQDRQNENRIDLHRGVETKIPAPRASLCHHTSTLAAPIRSNMGSK